jgi:pimeloyl-ACP methyl ester carboxylesterase
MSLSTLAEFDRHRHRVDTASGPVSYVDVGDGPAALFVHGVGTSSYLWRAVIAQVADTRRCIALDLPVHGSTPATAAQDYSIGTMATFVADVRAALGLERVDLVANDTGGAIAQIVTARDPQAVRTLTLTNCETHDNVPPKSLRPGTWLARARLFAPLSRRLFGDVGRARKQLYGPGYQDRSLPSDEQIRAWVTPLIGTPQAARQFERWVAAMRPDDLLAVEPQLARLQVPTLVVWGTDDMFFPMRDAYWLRDTIPGAGEVVELAGARLFFPDERADELAAALLKHWTVNAPTES